MHNKDVTIVFTHEMQELLNKALNDGLTFREGAFMMKEIQEHIVPEEVSLDLPTSACVKQSP